MSEAENLLLQETNPNLFNDVLHGRLPEANRDFKEVADRHPLTEEN